MGGFEGSAVVGGKAPLFWPCFIYCAWEQQHSTQFCQAGQEVKEKVQGKNLTSLRQKLVLTKMSGRKEYWRIKVATRIPRTAFSTRPTAAELGVHDLKKRQEFAI